MTRRPKSRLAPLDRKLFRELVRMRGQALAIALVIGAGVAMNVLMLSTFHSLELTQQTYYDRFRFAEVFASLKRAPFWLEEDIADLPDSAKLLIWPVPYCPADETFDAIRSWVEARDSAAGAPEAS